MDQQLFSNVSKDSAEHYHWGNACDGWHFLRSDSLSVIRETMPPGTQEQLHYHRNAQQFLYVISGTATFEVDGKEVQVAADEGIHIAKGAVHRIRNDQDGDLHFLVISEPKAHGDRVNVEALE